MNGWVSGRCGWVSWWKVWVGELVEDVGGRCGWVSWWEVGMGELVGGVGG